MTRRAVYVDDQQRDLIRTALLHLKGGIDDAKHSTSNRAMHAAGNYTQRRIDETLELFNLAAIDKPVNKP